METWDRELLYSEIWETPLSKLAVKYGISAVALGKVCRKLQIPLPGRGYWAKKEFGKPVKQIKLPEGKDLPVVHRMKFVRDSTDASKSESAQPPIDDPELIRIAKIEEENFGIEQNIKQHKLVTAAARILKHAPTDPRHILYPPYSEPCLDIRVSKTSLDRALTILNAIILKLESMSLAVTIERGPDRSGALIEGRRALFVLVEKARVINRRQVPMGSSTTIQVEYEPTGQLEFRVGGHGYGCKKTIKDRKHQKLEDSLSVCMGAILREGRNLRIKDEEMQRREIENRKRTEKLEKLRVKIEEEEEKVRTLDKWVTNWTRAEHIRGFVTVLEKLWTAEGHDVSLNGQKGQRLLWMKEQADRLDPLVHPSPPSILDRKGELSSW